MSRRARAIAFAGAALACAGLAAALASGYRAQVENRYGPLRAVVVARAELAPRRRLSAAEAERLLAVRRVPASFVPPGTLSAPAEAAGRVPVAPIPPGAYVLAAQLRSGRAGARPRRRAGLAPGREPVELQVAGASALAAGGRDPVGSRVDVVVTSEPGPGGRGHTAIAARGAVLLALASAPGGGEALPGPAAMTATLAVRRGEALRLIEAENFAREVRLIPARP